jgi:hypothetical protein
MNHRDYYLGLRNRYLPSKLNLLFILESPPVSGKYFYDETGKITEPLFSAFMKLLSYRPTDKKDGLKHFKNEGFFLVNATYKQVNKLRGKIRDYTILSDYNRLIDELETLCLNKNVPIILVKANICRMFDERLTERGFNILNKGVVIPFPSHGQQKRFYLKMSKVLSHYFHM